MTKLETQKQSLIPVIVMVCFMFLLIGALLLKVYHADRDLGMLRSEKYQARLASESGINYAVARMNEALRLCDKPIGTEALTSSYFESFLSIDEWKEYGLKSRAMFKVTSIRKLSIEDASSTPLLNEEEQYQVIAEGRCGTSVYSTAAIVQVYDLVKHFGVFQSLDEFYYGTPLQPYVSDCGSFNKFYEANSEFFDSGKITNKGKILDPLLLVKMYEIGGKSPFKTPNNILDNYSKFFSRNGISPSRGAIYSSLPVVVDSHEFHAPVQSALYFYCRAGSNPVLKSVNSVIKMNTSSRVQHLSENLGQRNLTKYFVDRDSIKYSAFIPSWNPDMEHLRKLSKSRGIYIDGEGKGFLNGSPIDIDYHPGAVSLYSDSYITQNSSQYEQDELENEKYVVLASEANYNGYNNISAANLHGARIIFSERSVYLRGDIGSDLVIVTPGHIYITGPTNIDSNLNLLLVAAEGTAISTVDLEEVIAKNNPTPEFIEAAREWIIRAVIYKPGAGIYSKESRVQKDTPINFRGVVGGKSLKLNIIGSCVGGNLQRWINNTEAGSLFIEHDPKSAERLIAAPFTANLLRLRTRPMKQ